MGLDYFECVGLIFLVASYIHEMLDHFKYKDLHSRHVNITPKQLRCYASRALLMFVVPFLTLVALENLSTLVDW